MESYWKAAGAVLIASILGLAVGKKDKDIAQLLSMAVCCMIGLLAAVYLEPVIGIIQEMEQLGQLNPSLTGTILKAAGIAMVTEIAAMTCADSGNGSMGKALQMLGTTVILWFSVPIVRSFFTLLQEMLCKI